jgi:lysophospholipase L1-like esterase
VRPAHRTVGGIGVKQAQPPTKRRRRLWAALSAAASVLLCLVIAEAVLRIAGFSYELRASIVQGADAADLRERYDGCRIDRDLIWVPTRYAERLEHARSLRPDVLFLGDSCTELGLYYQFFDELVRERHPDRPLTSAKLGVTGWSSHQGLQQLKRDVLGIRPRIITIYFGWNDHWNSIGFTDAEWTAKYSSPLFHLHALRLAQLFNKAQVGLRRAWQDQPPLRVPPDEFRRNLTQMVRLARDGGIVPVLLTAPAAHEPGSEPACLAGRWVTRLSDLIPLHQRYVQIVRDVAEAEGAVLCDVAAEFGKLSDEDRQNRLFREDGIHLQRDGDRLIARLVLECLESNDLLTPP